MYCRSAWCRTNKLDLLATWLQDHRVQEPDLRPGRDLPGAGRKYFLASQSVPGFRLSRCVWSSRWHCMQGAGRCNSRKRSPSQSYGRYRFAYLFSGGAQDLAPRRLLSMKRLPISSLSDEGEMFSRNICFLNHCNEGIQMNCMNRPLKSRGVNRSQLAGIACHRI